MQQYLPGTHLALLFEVGVPGQDAPSIRVYLERGDHLGGVTNGKVRDHLYPISRRGEVLFAVEHRIREARLLALVHTEHVRLSGDGHREAVEQHDEQNQDQDDDDDEFMQFTVQTLRHIHNKSSINIC